jgi:hypothetical protein
MRSTERRKRAATVGVAEHGSSAVLVTIAPGGTLLDRRSIDLTDRSLPMHPHHHEGSWAVGRDVGSFLTTMGRSIGPPWQAKHKLAAAAALAVTDRD